ncbi:MAG: DUF4911 domain-containing protein [Nitrospinae bacterium]|nr:DUF4911 domain-containing protein [Nitrospinota bacterium]
MDNQKEFQARRVILKCDPPLIADVHAIVESYDYLAVVRTLEPDMGIVELIATQDTFAETLELCKNLEKSIGAEILHP